MALDVVTGAFSYTGRAIALELLARGREVRTLTRRPAPGDHPLAGRVAEAPLQFEDAGALRASLAGAETLYVTFWIRFPHGDWSFERAVESSRRLFAAAAEAGVGRIVLVSVSNPSDDSPLPYFRGKAAVEQAVRTCGVPAAIVRPTLVFGRDDILFNNIAWSLRRFPVFPVAGDGRYRVQPVSVEDTAAIAVDLAERGVEEAVDAAGPEVLAYEELVRLVAAAIGRPARVVHLPGWAVLAGAAAVGLVKRDRLLTRDELAALRAELLVSSEPPLGRASVREWLGRHGAGLGRRYVSELARNFRPYER